MAKAKRAANGTGSMSYDDKRKLYVYRVTTGVDEKGVLKRKKFYGRTQKEALEKYEAWKTECNNNALNINNDITLAEYGQKWLDGYSNRVEQSTAESYKYTLKIINQKIGDMLVVDIKARHVEKLLDDSTQKYSKSQTSKLRTMLNQILRKAEADEIIAKNPVPLAARTDYRQVQEEDAKDAYTAEEIKRIYQNLNNDGIGHSIRLMIGTGIGVGELLAITPSCIEPDGTLINVVKSLKRGEKGREYIGAVKAKRRKRIIRVPQEAIASALYLRNNANEYILEGAKKGIPMSKRRYLELYTEAIERIEGVRYLSPHCCRHSYISHMEDAGVDFAVIQALAGQSTQSSTINYIHPQSPAIERAVDMIDGILKK